MGQRAVTFASPVGLRHMPVSLAKCKHQKPVIGLCALTTTIHQSSLEWQVGTLELFVQISLDTRLQIDLTIAPVGIVVPVLRYGSQFFPAILEAAVLNLLEHCWEIVFDALFECHLPGKILVNHYAIFLIGFNVKKVVTSQVYTIKRACQMNYSIIQLQVSTCNKTQQMEHSICCVCCIFLNLLDSCDGCTKKNQGQQSGELPWTGLKPPSCKALRSFCRVDS